MKRIIILALAYIAIAYIAPAVIQPANASALNGEAPKREALNGEAPNPSWDSANASYAAGDYPAAITQYEQLLPLTSGHDRAEVYYNLGNACFKQGELAQSVLAYERCLRLAPGMKDARANLRFVESRITDRIEDNHSFFLADWALAVRNRLREPAWRAISVTCWILCLLGVLAFLFLPQTWMRRTGFHTAWSTFVVAVVCFICATTLHHRDATRSEAVVMRGAVAAKSSPDRSGTDLFTLHEGTKVHITDAIGTWSEVHVGQYVGWVETATLERI